jgi:hypothetical protein
VVITIARQTGDIKTFQQSCNLLWLAISLGDQKRYGEGFQFLKESLEIRKVLFGLASDEVSEIYITLSAFYELSGDYDSAVELIENGLADSKNLLGGDDEHSARFVKRINSLLEKKKGL